MKRLFFIPYIFLFVACTKIGMLDVRAATYYVSPTTASPAGNNSNAGTIAAPWATLSYALTQATTIGDIIHVNAGTYPAITTQMILNNGVTIEGAGRDVTTIPLTWNGGRPCIKAESYGYWGNTSYGNQHISGIKFTGSTTPGTPVGIAAIGINFRSNVWIYDCEFVDFTRTAVWFQGIPTYETWTTDNPYETRSGADSEFLPPTSGLCTGNRFYNNEVHNSCGVITGTDYSGELEVATQDGMLIYGNTMTAIGRSGNTNGVPIKLIGDCGFNRNTKIYNNTINAGHKSTNYWQFTIEVWWDLGGLEIYDNVLNGTIDLCDSWDQYSVGYGAKVYDNDIGYSTSANQWEPGIRLEGSHLDTYVFRNKFHNINIGIEVNNNDVSGATTWDGVHIYDNLMVDLSGPSWQCWGIYWGGSGTITNTSDVWDNIYIQHNTIVAASTSIDPTTYGIMLPTVQDANNVFIENNILINWERGAIWGDKTRIQATNIFIRNNVIYDSYNSNDPVYLNSYPTAGITYSGTVKADPLFLSSTDWRLSSISSPAYHTGYNTDIATDYAENSFHATTPSIGAYEFDEGEPEPEPSDTSYGKWNGQSGRWNGNTGKW